MMRHETHVYDKINNCAQVVGYRINSSHLFSTRVRHDCLGQWRFFVHTLPSLPSRLNTELRFLAEQNV